MTAPTTAPMTSTEIDPAVTAVLADVYDPCCREKGISVVDMGLLHRARVESGVATVELVLTTGWCPFATTVLADIEAAVRALPEVEAAHVDIVWEQAWTSDRLSDSARAKLRFLPDPAEVDDVAAYVVEHERVGGRRNDDDR